MPLSEDWDMPHENRGWGVADAGMGALRITLLFGSAAVAMALILTPLIKTQAERIVHARPAGIDMMATGAIGQHGAGSYTIRRSVLQPSPNSVCIIRQNGMQTGDC